MSKKSKKIDQQIDSINQINLTNKIVEELLSKANPDELFGKYEIPPVVLVNFNILKNISKFLQNVVVLDLIKHCKPVICFQIYSLAL